MMKQKERFSLATAKKECVSLREKILLACYENGGHLSSNLGMVETTYMLLKNFDPFADDILFDVGHQTYPYKLLTGRSLSRLRQYQGTAPFSYRKESKADKYDNGHSGDSLPTGIGMALSKRLRNDTHPTVVIVGDASLENGLAQEALELLSKHKELKHFLLIVNSNSMAIKESTDDRALRLAKIRDEMISYRERCEQEGSYTYKEWKRYLKAKQKDLLMTDSLEDRFLPYGLRYLGPWEGHDLLGLNIAFQQSRKEMEKGPVIMEIMTKKGMGYAPSEEDKIGIYHGVKKGFSQEETITFSAWKQKTLMDLMSQDETLYLLTPAMETSSSLTQLFQQFPKRTLDVGIAEENAVAVASGLALKGYYPIIDIYSTFLQRSMDEVIENFSRQELSSTFLLERASLVGEDGSSHQGIFDVALLRAVPSCEIYMPFDKDSLAQLLKLCTSEKHGLRFIRMSKEPSIPSHAADFQLPVSYLVRDEKNTTLYLATGVMGYQALSACTLPGDKGLLVTLNPQEINDFKRYKKIYFYDPYSTTEGASLNLQSLLFRQGYQGEYHALTLRQEFYAFGSLSDVYRAYHMTPEDANAFFQEEE